MTNVSAFALGNVACMHFDGRCLVASSLYRCAGVGASHAETVVVTCSADEAAALQQWFSTGKMTPDVDAMFWTDPALKALIFTCNPGLTDERQTVASASTPAAMW